MVISSGARSTSRTHAATVPDTVPLRGSTTSGADVPLNARHALEIPLASLTCTAWKRSPATERTKRTASAVASSSSST